MSPEEFRELRTLLQIEKGKRDHQLMGCAGKSRFVSRESALHTMRGRLRDECVPYRCRDCGGWHVGSKLAGQRKRKAQRFNYRRLKGMDS